MRFHEPGDHPADALNNVACVLRCLTDLHAGPPEGTPEGMSALGENGLSLILMACAETVLAASAAVERPPGLFSL